MNAYESDYGPCPSVINIERETMTNDSFRVAVWTGEYAQMTVMSIPPCDDIGLEIHEDTDQIIRVEQGCALVKMGCDKCRLDFCQLVKAGDVIFVPAGTWHNIINNGKCALKVSSVYAPPHHPRGTVQRTKPVE